MAAGAGNGGAAKRSRPIDHLARSDLGRTFGIEAFAPARSRLEMRRLKRGETLVEQDSAGDEVFVLVRGELEIVISHGDEEQEVGRLAAGATVGEISMLTGNGRSATVRATRASAVVAIPGAEVARVLADHPAEADGLARVGLERLRRTQLIGVLSALFGHLESEVVEQIDNLIEWTSLTAGERLFAEGDSGDAAYLVVSGRLRAFQHRGSGREVDLGDVGPAEIVGEMALLEDAARTASIYAARDTHLARFSRRAYDLLLERYPQAGLLVAQTVLRRTRQRSERPRQRDVSVVLVPGSPGIDIAAFAAEVTAALGASSRYITSAVIDGELGIDGLAQVDDDAAGAMRLSYWLEQQQAEHRHLVYGVDAEWTPWSRRALRWADQVVVVADASADPAPGPFEQELWKLVGRHRHPASALALVHPEGTELPSGTRRWLDARDVAAHHHLRRGDRGHVERLARSLTGTSTSVVLGGGGARGFAHVGVLGALEQLGRPVDMIGGSSIGAIMAVGPGMGWSASRAREISVEEFQDLFDYTFPSVALLRGERITRRLERVLGEVDIADLWIPYFCVTTNITSAGAEYHDRGRLSRLIRASIAIPGVLPPVPIDGDLHVDGGVLDNVPVDEMRRRNPTGAVIAIDVAPADGPRAEADYGLSVRGLSSHLARRRGGGPPSLLATLVRSSLVASVRDRDRVVKERVADLYLDVTVDGAGLLDFSAAEQLASSGEAVATDPLRAWQAAGSGGDGEYVKTAPVQAPVPRSRRGVRPGGVAMLTVRDLQFRAVRFGAVIVGTAVVFALLFLMTGLVEQFHREPRSTVDRIGAEAWVLRDGASGAFTSAATMPGSVVGDVAVAAGVEAAPIVVARHSIRTDGEPTDIVVIGITPGALGTPELLDGQLPATAEEVVVDDSAELAVGDEARIGATTYRVTGRTDGTTMFAGMPLVFMDLAVAQELVYRGQDVVTAVLLADAPAAVPDGFASVSPDQIAEDGTRPLERSISSVNLIRILLWFVAAMIIGTMVYLSALERRRDVAVLKAIGSSTGQLATSIALQGALTALVASVLAAGLQAVLVPVFPLEVSVPGRAMWQIPLLAVIVSLLAGGLGLRSAVRTDPALAFSGPGA